MIKMKSDTIIIWSVTLSAPSQSWHRIYRWHSRAYVAPNKFVAVVIISDLIHQIICLLSKKIGGRSAFNNARSILSRVTREQHTSARVNNTHNHHHQTHTTRHHAFNSFRNVWWLQMCQQTNYSTICRRTSEFGFDFICEQRGRPISTDASVPRPR